MKQSIEKAMAELNMGREELSSALGMSRPYITKMLTRPQSEKTQSKVVKMIDDLMHSVDGMRQLGGAFRDNSIATNDAEKAMKELSQALEYKDQLLAKNVDEYKNLSATINERDRDIKLKEIAIRDLEEIVLDGTKDKTNSERSIKSLSIENEMLNRKNKDLNIAYMVVCVILTALVVWGFYV